MEEVTINWGDNVIEFQDIFSSDNFHLDSEGFYVLFTSPKELRGPIRAPSKILYIGYSLGLTLRERIPLEGNLYPCVNEYISRHRDDAIILAA